VEVSGNGRRCNAGREGTPVLTVVHDLPAALPADAPVSVIEQIVREGARQVLVTRLTEQWKDGAAAFMARDLQGVD
jgi:hypothetical protein